MLSSLRWHPDASPLRVALQGSFLYRVALKSRTVKLGAARDCSISDGAERALPRRCASSSRALDVMRFGCAGNLSLNDRAGMLSVTVPTRMADHRITKDSLSAAEHGWITRQTLNET